MYAHLPKEIQDQIHRLLQKQDEVAAKQLYAYYQDIFKKGLSVQQQQTRSQFPLTEPLSAEA